MWVEMDSWLKGIILNHTLKAFKIMPHKSQCTIGYNGFLWKIWIQEPYKKRRNSIRKKVSGTVQEWSCAGASACSWSFLPCSSPSPVHAAVVTTAILSVLHSLSTAGSAQYDIIMWLADPRGAETRAEQNILQKKAEFREELWRMEQDLKKNHRLEAFGLGPGVPHPVAVSSLRISCGCGCFNWAKHTQA